MPRISIFQTDFLDVPLELLVSNRQRVEELLQGDRGARLPGMRRLLHEVALVVEHQLGADLAGLVAGDYTEVAVDGEV